MPPISAHVLNLESRKFLMPLSLYVARGLMAPTHRYRNMGKLRWIFHSIYPAVKRCTSGSIRKSDRPRHESAGLREHDRARDAIRNARAGFWPATHALSGILKGARQT